MKILVVEDERDLNRIITKHLKKNNYSVDSCFDGEEALDFVSYSDYDLIITDIMMPKMDGYDFISEVQYLSPDQPFLFITAKTSEQDKIFGLSMGADDFITKPFSPRELVLRVNNIFKRIYRGGNPTQVQLGNLKLNHETYEVYVDNHLLNLTIKAFELLWILCKNPERVFSKTELYEKVWQEEFIDDTNTLNVHIHALRQELSKHSSLHTPTIKTVWGLGYKIEKPRGSL